MDDNHTKYEMFRAVNALCARLFYFGVEYLNNRGYLKRCLIKKKKEQ